MAQRNLRSLGWRLSLFFKLHVLAPLAEDSGHPDQLLEKLVEASDVGRLDQRARSVEGFLHRRKVAVPEDRHKAELAHHGQEVLDDARAAERACRDAADADGLVYVLGEVRVERVLEQPRIAVVVLRHDEDEGVGAHARLGELRVLDARAFVVRGEAQPAYVYQLGLDAPALAQLSEDEARDVLAHAPLARRAEDDGDEEWAFVCHAVPLHSSSAETRRAMSSSSLKKCVAARKTSRASSRHSKRCLNVRAGSSDATSVSAERT